MAAAAGQARQTGPSGVRGPMMIRSGVRAFFRTWWPILTIIGLALLSIEMLRRSHSDARRLLQQTATGLENVQESRRRLTGAYLVHSLEASGDRTFDREAAQAELGAAEHALEDWMRGTSGIVDFAAPPADTALIPLALTYQTALSNFSAVLMSESASRAFLRQSFSYADQAAAALETAINNSLRASVETRDRAYRMRLTGWSLLLLLSLLGAAFTHRALTRSESGLAQSEYRLSRLRELAPVGIVECDEAGLVLVANWMWTQLTGRPEEEWHGRPWWEALDENDRNSARRLWDRSRDVDARHHGTIEARLDARLTSHPLWVLVRVGAVSDDDENARRVVTFGDITHQRQVEEQLHHAQRMEAVGRLAGGVAHDFNNLLTSIRGFASLSFDAAPGNDQLRADLLEIERAADRGRALTRQLLTFSRQDRIDPQVIDARMVVSDLKRMLDRLVRDGIRIVESLSDVPAKVLVDRGQLEQVITNLVVNASDAMEGTGRIRIGVETLHIEEPFQGAKSEIEPGDYVLLSVSDTGAGIPTEIQERVFEPFFTTKERGKGTGLGLSTVWGIVRQGGGHVHLYSAAGQGTVFKIYMPAASGDLVEGPQCDAVTPQPVAAPGTALVVEDEDAVRRLTTRILELRGWTVLSAPGGAEALEIVATREGPIDLMITDLMMRGMGGLELAAVLREQGIHLPTLFVSGYAESELDLAGEHFLEKPFTPAALIRSVTEVIRESRESDAAQVR